MSMKTLKIEELSKNFGTTEVLRKINLEIDEGNFGCRSEGFFLS